jgi:biopolymer transport protein ExbD
MFRLPSRRRNKIKSEKKLDLIPIMDSIFTYIFFLLMSSSLIKLSEIHSDMPFVSDQEVEKKEKPLALTVEIKEDKLEIYQGNPSVLKQTFKNLEDGNFDLEEFHNYLVQLKKEYPGENDAFLFPDEKIEYEKIIHVMDAIRIFKNTDETLFVKDKDGIDTKMEFLFNNIIFGNI